MPNMAEQVQLEIIGDGKYMLPEGRMRKGMTFWTDRRSADHYINRMGIAKPVGPSETKPAGPLENKSSDETQVRRSTASQRSDEYGEMRSSSASQEDPVSPESNVTTSKRRGRPRKSAQ